MANPTWPLDPHTRAKHEILRHYLGAWFPKITAYNGRVVYVDGFAGPGIYTGGELGSPILALQTLLDHPALKNMRSTIVFVFIEKHRRRFASLQEQLAKLNRPANVEVIPHNGEFDQAMGEVFRNLETQGSQLAPTLALIDPFGVSGVRMEHIARMMKSRGCEVLINFMSSRIHRFISHPRFEPHVDALYGTQDWRKFRDLQGEDRLVAVRQFFRERLHSADGAGAAYTRFFRMRDAKNIPVYELCFATNHPAGIDAMKDAMWKVDPVNGAGFSSYDASQDQLDMFKTGGQDYGPRLVQELHRQFHGQTVRWPVVEEAIRNSDFPISRSKLKEAAKQVDAAIAINNPPGSRALDVRSTITFK